MRRTGASLRARITTVLVGTSVLSVLLVASASFVLLDDLLSRRAEGQLASVRDDRVAALERAVEGLASTTSALAADPGVVAAFADLAGAWRDLGPDLTPAARAALGTSLAADVADLPAALDVPRPEATALVAGSVPGRRAQQLYVADNPEASTDRAALDDAGDGSDWTAAHARHHPFLRGLVEGSLASDVLFVSADGLDVVYSVAKHADLGTDVTTGPWRATGLGAVVAQLPQLASGDTAVVDSGFHPPAGTVPRMFLASAVRSGSQVLGALVVSVPIAGLTDFVTAQGRWELLGLGDTGQVYVVGGDGTLRTEPRGWREEPDAWLAGLADADEGGEAVAALVTETGSPVQVQPVATDAVAAAADGEDVVVADDGLTGSAALSAAAPVDAAGLDWVLVVEQDRAETSASVSRFLTTLGLLLLVLVPLIVAVGVLVARSLVRPHRPVIEASARLATGDTDIALPDLGTNELGDLARQLEGVADEIEARRRVIAEEDRRIEELLSAVVPPRLMASVRAGERSVADVLDAATVVVVTVVGLPDDGREDDVVAFTGRVARELERAAAEHGLEPAGVASKQEQFLAGHGMQGTQALAAARFAVGVPALVRSVGRTFELEVDARVGMAAGQVGTGLVGTDHVTYAMWGDPPTRAATLDGLARPGEVLVDGTVAAELRGTDGWLLEQLPAAAGLDEEPIEAWVLRSSVDEPAPVGGPG